MTKKPALNSLSVSSEADTCECMDESPIINSTLTAKINSNPLLRNKGNVIKKNDAIFKDKVKYSKLYYDSDELQDDKDIKLIKIKDLDAFISSKECSDINSNELSKKDFNVFKAHEKYVSYKELPSIEILKRLKNHY